MDMDSYTQVCTRIVARCQRYHWYGPDGGAEDHRYYFDADGKLHTREITHDYRRGFEFPPATAEQLQATEEALGFALPPMLRALYTHVANGGFGPAYGITGARGGYYFGDDGRYQTIDRCTDTNPTVHYFDLSEYEKAHGNPTYFELRETIKPAHFLHLCYEGCGSDFYLDGNSGRIYLTACCGSLSDSQLPNEVLPGKLRPEWMVGYQRVADSLGDWLERWLRGEAMDDDEVWGMSETNEGNTTL